MKNTGCCPKCHSRNIVRVPDNAHRYLAHSIAITKVVTVERESWVENQHELNEIKKGVWIRRYRMGWDIDVREKVYQRLANEIFFRSLRGEYALGAKLPSYIEIAKEAGSSPETVRKAIRELQQHSVIEKTRWGYFVSSDEAVIAAYRQQYLESIAKEYRSAIAKLEN